LLLLIVPCSGCVLLAAEDSLRGRFILMAVAVAVAVVVVAATTTLAVTAAPSPAGGASAAATVDIEESWDAFRFLHGSEEPLLDML
jgi:Rieske Fe-S protein